jgi:hypothetical protein
MAGDESSPRADGAAPHRTRVLVDEDRHLSEALHELIIEE